MPLARRIACTIAVASGLVAPFHAIAAGPAGRLEDLELGKALAAAEQARSSGSGLDIQAPQALPSGCLPSSLPSTPSGGTVSFTAQEGVGYGFTGIIWRLPCVNDGSKFAVLMRATPYGNYGAWICSVSWSARQGVLTTSSPKWVTSNGGAGLCNAFYSPVTVALDQWSFYSQFDDQTAFSLRSTYFTLSPNPVDVPAAGAGATQKLTVQITGTGSGTVASSPAGINCRSGTCSATFGQNRSVTLTASPDTNHSFASWSGDCGGTSRTATVTLSADRTCTARFNKPPVNPQTGWWWASSEPGRGYSIETANGRIFMASYAYRGDGTAAWYLSTGAWNGTELVGTFDEYRGGQTFSGSWRQAVATGSAGNFSLSFTTPTRGTITWSNGQSTTIERFTFASAAATADAPGGPVAGIGPSNGTGQSKGAAATAAADLSDEPKRLQALQDLTAARGRQQVIVTLAGDAKVATDRSLAQAMLAPHGGKVTSTFSRLPIFAAEVTPAGLDALLNDPAVAAVHENRMNRFFLSASIPKVRASELHARNLKGAGRSVAIIDSGVDASHPFLGGRIVAEACFSSGHALYQAPPSCPNGATSMIGPGSGAPCIHPSCLHGTHVAGIAAGGGSGLSGVAPGASIVALQVTTEFPASACGTTTSCISPQDADVISGLAWVRDNAAAYGIASVNLSLGGGAYSSYCDSEPHKPVIDQLRAMGIATVIATGNSFQASRVSSPACISSAVRVSAVSNADAVADFANEWSLPLLMAPGNPIYSSVPGGGYASLPGTSMATPHVAGAWALLKAAIPGASVTTLYNALSTTGTGVRSPWTSRTYPRIDVASAYDRLTMIETGWWWNPAEPGTGYFVEVQRDQVFLSAYMYRDDGTAVWYVANGAYTGGTFQGPTMEFAGGQWMGGSWRQAGMLADRGQVTLRSNGPGAATLTLPSGRQVSLSRFSF